MFGSAVRRHLDQDGQGDVGTAARIAAGQVTELDEHRDRRVRVGAPAGRRLLQRS